METSDYHCSTASYQQQARGNSDRSSIIGLCQDGVRMKLWRYVDGNRKSKKSSLVPCLVSHHPGDKPAAPPSDIHLEIEAGVLG